MSAVNGVNHRGHFWTRGAEALHMRTSEILFLLQKLENYVCPHGPGRGKRSNADISGGQGRGLFFWLCVEIFYGRPL